MGKLTARCVSIGYNPAACKRKPRRMTLGEHEEIAQALEAQYEKTAVGETFVVIGPTLITTWVKARTYEQGAEIMAGAWDLITWRNQKCAA